MVLFRQVQPEQARLEEQARLKARLILARWRKEQLPLYPVEGAFDPRTALLQLPIADHPILRVHRQPAARVALHRRPLPVLGNPTLSAVPRSTRQSSASVPREPYPEKIVLRHIAASDDVACGRARRCAPQRRIAGRTRDDGHAPAQVDKIAASSVRQVAARPRAGAPPHQQASLEGIGGWPLNSAICSPLG